MQALEDALSLIDHGRLPTTTPIFGGRGSYIEQMAGWSGKFSKSPWPLIRRLHEERFRPRTD